MTPIQYAGPLQTIITDIITSNITKCMKYTYINVIECEKKIIQQKATEFQLEIKRLQNKFTVLLAFNFERPLTISVRSITVKWKLKSGLKYNSGTGSPEK